MPAPVRWWRSGAPRSGGTACTRAGARGGPPTPDRYLVLVWANWPAHANPTVLAEAASQRITRRWLPTAAPWANPIEQLWRWLKQTVVHHHRLADRWDALKAAVTTVLAQVAHGSDALLRDVGLPTD